MRLEVSIPKGYTRLDEPRALIVARADIADALRSMYRSAPADAPTLHGYASRDATARAMHGRETAYAMALPGNGLPVVVRHNRHGGLLRNITGDLFLGATRAPMELGIALHLAKLGVPTPVVVGFGVYPAGSGFARSDVVTEEIPGGIDFGALLLATEPDSDERRRGWNAVRRLLKRLASAGVRHHDLNVKNILLRPADDELFAAYALDVDRVEFDCTRRDAYAGNRARLRRSLEKWRTIRGARVTEAELDALRRTAPSIP